MFGVKVCVWVSQCGLGPLPVLWGRLGLQCFPTFLRFSGEGGAKSSSSPRHKPALVNRLLRTHDAWSSTPWLWLVYELVPRLWQVRDDSGCLQLSLSAEHMVLITRTADSPALAVIKWQRERIMVFLSPIKYNPLQKPPIMHMMLNISFKLLKILCFITASQWHICMILSHLA